MTETLAFCESQRDWAVDTIEALARIESPTFDKPAVDRCGREVASRLAALGADVERLAQQSAGDHLLARFGRGPAQILILGHFDTVWPIGQIERMPVVRRDGHLHGPGVFDMKAGITLGMLAARALFERGPSPDVRLAMLLTSDEEIGSPSSRAAIEAEARRSAAVLVLEPSLPGGTLKTQRKGCGEFHLVVHGVAAHAGVEPEKGASAIQELARQIVAVGSLQDLARGVSVNVGTVQGGTRTNVVAEEASAQIDVRVPTMADARRIEHAMAALRPATPRTTVEVTGSIDRPPLERTPAVVKLYEMARQVAAGLGHDLKEGSTGGGSDGNFTAALGVPTLDGLGAVGDGIHALHEQVDIAALPWRAALIAGLIGRIAADTMTRGS